MTGGGKCETLAAAVAGVGVAGAALGAAEGAIAALDAGCADGVALAGD
jgi:hypothetical protein